MALYCGIDLHAKDHVVVVIDDDDKVMFEHRLTNDLTRTLHALEPFRDDLEAVAVESTFNWYWLVDGLAESGHSVRLVNTSAIGQYSGLKHTDDRRDARWLAHLMRLKILPTGYVYPKADRAVRDLLRQRARLVRQRTANLLSLKNLFARQHGRMVPATELKKLTLERLHEVLPDDILWHTAALGEEARTRDFYRPGDTKVVFWKPFNALVEA